MPAPQLTWTTKARRHTARACHATFTVTAAGPNFRLRVNTGSADDLVDDDSFATLDAAKEAARYEAEALAESTR